MKAFISSMSARTKWAITLCLGMALMILVLIACQPQIEVQTMGVTNLDSLHLGDVAATETPILMVDGQSGNAGNLLEVRVAATPVYAILAAGTQDMQGNLSDSQGTFTIADDVLVDGQADTEQLVVQGAASQGDWYFTVEDSAGSDLFNVGPSGNITVAGTSNLVGNLSSTDAAITVTDNVMVDGQAAAIQLTVQGHTDQDANDVFVVEESGGTDDFTIAADGSVTATNQVFINGTVDTSQLLVQGLTGQGTYLVTVEQGGGTDVFNIDNSGNITVAGTSDLVGNLFDDAGALTIADDVLVDGQADTEQLIVQGAASQGDWYFTVEDSAGSDLFNIGPSGNITVAGTSNLVGNLSSTDAAITVTDNVMVDGQAAAIQLTVQGHTDQDANDLFVVETSAASDLFNIAADGSVTVTADLQDSAGTFTIIDDVLVDGQADAIQLSVQGAAGQGSDLLIAESSGGTDVFNVGIAGAITYSVSYANAAEDLTNIIEAYSAQGVDIFRIQNDGGTDPYVVVSSTGQMAWRSGVISTTGLSYVLTVSNSASLVTNQGIDGAGYDAGSTQVIDLPDAAEGLHFCFVNWTANDAGPTMAINPADDDQVAFLTNGDGDVISNTTNGDAICLTAQDDVFWLPTSETGTWADGD